MLEKIGLPPKPSLRGNNWVIDATHCQGCSSQFTFINRKHHCRRCGGLFCGSCTQQRMYLRGQGESPVRICEPCKTLEEAARFEMRYGHKNKSRRGATKLASDNDDDLLTKVNESISSEKESVHLLPSASSSSNTDMEIDLESTTPEELRQKAVEEKKKYKTLKAEGKPEEALKAFKRGKELERQAGTLEIELRKNRKKALLSNESTKGGNGNGKQPKQKDDLVSELKELGWSDLDLHDDEKKPVNLTLEGELSTLIKQVSQKSSKPEKGNSGIDKSEVIAIKKKALAFKREGKLTEAKEELKKAKILEKQIEERELLGDDSGSDSDDEFKSLIRSMDIDKQDILASGNDNRNRNIGLDFDFDFDQNPDFEVTEEDMDDPEMSAALQSLGWTEDQPVNDDVADVSEKIQSLKREALIKKRAGQTNEALALLKEARMLEKGEKNENDDVGTSVNLDSGPKVGPKMGPKNKLAIQRELLAIKKKALALRREGKADEADEELAKGKALEQQLEELETGPKVKPTIKPVDLSTPMEVDDEGEDVTDTDMNDPSYLSLLQNLGWQEEEVKVKVDFSPPKPQSKSDIQKELLALKRKSLALRREGKADEAEEVLQKTKGLEAQLAELEGPNLEKETVEKPLEEPKPVNEPVRTVVDELETGSVQERVMAHKRKALKLKREGKIAEAKEELKMAKLLENKNGDTDAVDQTAVPVITEPSGSNVVEPEVIETSPPVKLSSRDRFKLQQESLKHKRQAMKLRREGRADEAEAEFELAKNLESQLEAASVAANPGGLLPGDDVGVEDLLDPQLLMALREVGIEGGGGGVRSSPEKVVVKKAEVVAVKGEAVVVKKSERVELEEQIKAEKVEAVKLKRAGKQGEALDALRRAKLLEKKLSSLT